MNLFTVKSLKISGIGECLSGIPDRERKAKAWRSICFAAAGAAAADCTGITSLAATGAARVNLITLEICDND